MPVIGFLETVSANFGTRILVPFRQGLGEAGYVEGQNVAIEYRWAEDAMNGCRSWQPIWSAAG